MASGVTEALLQRLRGRSIAATAISDGRYSFDLGADAARAVYRGARGGRRVAGVRCAAAHDARRRVHGAHPVTARRIGLVAWHVFKESVRDRVLYGIGAFALLLVAARS